MSIGARERVIETFMRRAGWGDAELVPLAQDASFRRYLRAHRASETAVLMDAPPAHERTEPFLAMARHLRSLGFSAPRVFEADNKAGLMLLEDLGDNTFARLLGRGANETSLYRLATDVLISLHGQPAHRVVPPGLQRYDDALLGAEADLLIDWYAPAVLGKPLGKSASCEYRERWKSAFEIARRVPDTLVLRDFHIDNLMEIAGREGLAACGLVDFQDAVAGPLSYDFVSLVQDARRDLAPPVAEEMRARYLNAFPALDAAAFDASVAVLGAQRHCKVIGIFTRLHRRDGKPDYLDHIPRVWRLLQSAVGHECLAPIRDWLDTNLPPRLRVIPPRESAA